jgi:hypothetical protein
MPPRKQGFREEVLNVVLAQLLNERGVVSTPELSLADLETGHKMPDVLVVFQGLRTVIEGKVEATGARDAVQAQAVERVEQGIAHIGVGVLYPKRLRKVPFPDLRHELATAELGISICTEAGAQGWTTGNLDHLGDVLRRTFEDLVAEDVVTKAVAALEAGVARFAQALGGAPAVVERSAEILGIGEEPEAGDELE